MEIPLTQGKEALIDDCDCDLASLKWYAHHDGQGRYYATLSSSEKKTMHRIVLARIIGRELSRKELCDHINRDTLDNRRGNLRLANCSQNRMNARKSAKKNSIPSSIYKGVYWCKEKRRWRAHVYAHGHWIILGYFQDEKEAAHAYDNAVKKISPSFGVLNLPKDMQGNI